jgi:hypothetical protein
MRKFMMKGSPGIWESPLDGDDQLDNPLGSIEHLHDEMEATMRKLMTKGSPGNWESLGWWWSTKEDDEWKLLMRKFMMKGSPGNWESSVDDAEER